MSSKLADGVRALEGSRSGLRWMIEEFRLSLFAQDLRTLAPISAQRLEAQLARARAEATGG